jgi:DNA-binding SARP family transcriptional activator
VIATVDDKEQLAERLRAFAAEKSKGANKERALKALSELHQMVNMPVQPGDELPEWYKSA